MIQMFYFVLSFAILNLCHGTTLYEHFVPGGIVNSSLVANGPEFVLNGKPITIISGAFHYFRVHPNYWKDTFRKLRAAGLNTVETYVPWNLHEPRKGVFDFGALGEEMSPFLDVRKFIQEAQEEDLFVIFRPGPYICSEWEFGGLPSWLLREETIFVRTSQPVYEGFVHLYYQFLLSLLKDLTFEKGGPIIAVQIENEYGHYGYDDDPRDKSHLVFLQGLLQQYGFGSVLHFTSDTPEQTLDWGSLPGVLQMANFQSESDAMLNLDTLATLQPNRPAMVAEFWTGWFDHWQEGVHNTWDVDTFGSTLEYILGRNASVNFYMFIGGTNFGFMAGANRHDKGGTTVYTPIVSSYDYDAPLSEAGDYNEKYTKLRDTVAIYNPLEGVVDNPAIPEERNKSAYGFFQIEEILELRDIIDQITDGVSLTGWPINMEQLDINDDNGQSYGFIMYSCLVTLPQGNSTVLIRGHVRDMAQVFVNEELVSSDVFPVDPSEFGFWDARDKSLTFNHSGGDVQLSILVENLGRVNFGGPHNFQQKKGLWEGPVELNGQELQQWSITPLQFKGSFINSMTGWEPFTSPLSTPCVYQSDVNLGNTIQDTFLDMTGWTKGVVFVNGFNIGRYWNVGPTGTLYVPAPLLVQGFNKITVFEQFTSGSQLNFIDTPILDISNNTTVKES